MIPQGTHVPLSKRNTHTHTQASLMVEMVKNLPAMWVTWVQSLSWENPLEKGMVTHCNIIHGILHGQRSLVGYSPWGCKELNRTEQLIHTHTPEHKAAKLCV